MDLLEFRCGYHCAYDPQGSIAICHILCDCDPSTFHGYHPYNMGVSTYGTCACLIARKGSIGKASCRATCRNCLRVLLVSEFLVHVQLDDQFILLILDGIKLIKLSKKHTLSNQIHKC